MQAPCTSALVTRKKRMQATAPGCVSQALLPEEGVRPCPVNRSIKCKHSWVGGFDCRFTQVLVQRGDHTRLPKSYLLSKAASNRPRVFKQNKVAA
jgi:hypothetical protein